MFRTIRTRLTVICAVISVIALTAMAVGSYLVTRTQLLKDVPIFLHELLHARADAMTILVRERRLVVDAATSLLDEPDSQSVLEATRQSGNFASMRFTRADTGSTLSTEPLPAGYDGRSRPWYQMASASPGKAVFTTPYPSAQGGKTVVSIAHAVRGADGQLKGVVSGELKMEELTAVLDAFDPKPGSRAVLLSRNNLMLVTPKAKKDLLFRPVTDWIPELTPAVIDQIVATDEMTMLYTEGHDMQWYGTDIKDTPWRLLIAVPHDAAMESLTSMRHASLIIAAVALVLMVGFLAGSIQRQLMRLDEVGDALEDIANGEGDLTRRLNVAGRDELSRIGQSFNQFADKIAGVMRQIRASAQSVASSAEQIASGNADLSSRSEQQASSLEKTSSAMEEITATVQQNADNATQANSVGNEAAQVATRANAAVQQVVSTMGAISQSSNKIKDIIGVIDSIAFQTNILALNAAVEAARAGEQGRGFAVVAAEVRSLAQRSATAAKEIKDLIDESVSQAEAGSHLVGQAGEVMGQVVDSIGRVASIVGEITHASHEQSLGIAEVGSAITQMDQATQQNAALVEEATAAAQSLHQQAEHLNELVAQFKLESSGLASKPVAKKGLLKLR